MKITVLTIGKKHEPWVEEGIKRFQERLRGAFSTNFEIIPQSGKQEDQARTEESHKILNRLPEDSLVVLLDERGKNLSSPELSSIISSNQKKSIIFIIGGAYGVSPELRNRADIVWSLSRLVFPHQLVRLILAEQIYRAQEISKGSSYHHD